MRAPRQQQEEGEGEEGGAPQEEEEEERAAVGHPFLPFSVCGGVVVVWVSLSRVGGVGWGGGVRSNTHTRFFFRTTESWPADLTNGEMETRNLKPTKPNQRRMVAGSVWVAVPALAHTRSTRRRR